MAFLLPILFAFPVRHEIPWILRHSLFWGFCVGWSCERGVLLTHEGWKERDADRLGWGMRLLHVGDANLTGMGFRLREDARTKHGGIVISCLGTYPLP